MLEVLDINEGGLNVGGLGRYIVAALLNARSGRTPVLTEAGVRAMWNDLINQGYYEPAPGIRWTSAEIITYHLFANDDELKRQQWTRFPAPGNAHSVGRLYNLTRPSSAMDGGRWEVIDFD